MNEAVVVILLFCLDCFYFFLFNGISTFIDYLIQKLEKVSGGLI